MNLTTQELADLVARFSGSGVITGEEIRRLLDTARGVLQSPLPMLLWCPSCHARHIDEGVFATRLHKTHSCQHCGLLFAPALIPTVGVQFLPGCKNDV
jgi:hypothetical protein